MAARHAGVRSQPAARGPPGGAAARRPTDPIITFSPTFACPCPRALKVLVTATVVGLLTGFLGVGGGFLVVPALVLALGLAVAVRRRHLAGRDHLTSAVALAVRAGAARARLGPVVRPHRRRRGRRPRSAPGSPPAPTPAGSPAAFTALVLARRASYTAARALPALV